MKTVIKYVIFVISAGCIVIAITIFTIRKSTIFDTLPDKLPSLGMIRSAISTYYASTEGRYPATIEALVESKYTINDEERRYLIIMPTCPIRGYDGKKKATVSNQLNGAGGWYYNNKTGEVRINSLEIDDEGQPYSTW